MPRLYKENQLEFLVSRECELLSLLRFEEVANQRRQEPLNTEGDP
jgi:hypothetical protein